MSPSDRLRNLLVSRIDGAIKSALLYYDVYHAGPHLTAESILERIHTDTVYFGRVWHQCKITESVLSGADYDALFRRIWEDRFSAPGLTAYAEQTLETASEARRKIEAHRKAELARKAEEYRQWQAEQARIDEERCPCPIAFLEQIADLQLGAL